MINEYTFPHTQILHEPVDFGGNTYQQLEYAPLKLKAVRALGLAFSELGHKLAWTHVIKLAAAMTGKAPAKLEEMQGTDAQEMLQVVMYAWGKFHQTGGDE